MKINEFGRSMIEMLGVLAIIGVLSVGGIAGYSKAMQKYRVNKAIDEITTIVTGVQRAYVNNKTSSGWKYEGLNVIMLETLGLIDSNKVINYNTAENVFGGRMGVFLDHSYYDDEFTYAANEMFILYYGGLNKNVCISLSTQNWYNNEGFWGMYINNHHDGDTDGLGLCKKTDEEYYFHDGFIAACRQHYPLPMADVVSACSCTEENDCEIILGFE
ncbi:MAG: hypothetical protein MJ212_01810 [Alphaproteobacteria bacterium]|nr:hypothetical protein [Alphaproteobacteria bacterium]